MTEPLTIPAMKAAALSYHNKGLLGAQVFPGVQQCKYRYPESDARCGVGAAIPDEVYDSEWDRLAKVAGSQALSELFASREVQIFASILQAKHDAWQREDKDSAERSDYEAAFLRFIQEP